MVTTKGNNIIFAKICLLAWGFSLDNFSLIGTRDHDQWRTAIFDIWSALIAIEQRGSLCCFAYCDKGHPFIMVISEYPWHSRLISSVRQWSCHYLFLSLSRLRFKHTTVRLRGERSNPLRHRCGKKKVKVYIKLLKYNLIIRNQ